MNRRIARLGTGFVVLYVVLFARLNMLQVFQAQGLNHRSDNTRIAERDFNRPRGTISTADGVLVATSEARSGRFRYRRVYPHDGLYAHTVGWFSFNLGTAGVERTYADDLAGQTTTLQLRSARHPFDDEGEVGNLVLTLNHRVQQVARDALGTRRGSVVALDPRTGGVLALWTYPSFDPNPLADIDLRAAARASTVLNADPAKPLLAKAYQERYFPGSTFKLVTASAGLTSGKVTEAEPSYPVERRWTPPLTTKPLSNFDGSSCGGTLVDILRVSCNTAFARMGVQTVGADDMIAQAERYGFNDKVPIDLPRPATSVFPTDFERNAPALAQASIGQGNTSATPIQMALVVSAIAHEGRIMKPHVVDRVTDRRAETVRTVAPEEWKAPLDADTAAVLRRSMLEVVANGTASRLAIDGFEVGGKTGTAQLGTSPPRSHAWIVGFGGFPGEDPSVAVAVIVEGQPGASEQTGGKVAAPIARAVLAAALGAG